jgi:hypothetical protein
MRVGPDNGEGPGPASHHMVVCPLAPTSISLFARCGTDETPEKRARDPKVSPTRRLNEAAHSAVSASLVAPR